LDNGEAEHILSPKAGDEEHRITYVALSRAKSELFIYCPEQSLKSRFAALGVNVIELGCVLKTDTARSSKKPAKKKAT
jgi:ATP-dependent exoDNAse (exonuclease V) beta subunit